MDRYRKPITQAQYFDMGLPEEGKNRSPYKIMMNAWELLYEGAGMIDASILLFRMEVGKTTVFVHGDRDFFWLSAKFAPDQKERSIVRWYVCGQFKTMSRKDFEQWVLDQLAAYNKKCAERKMKVFQQTA